MENLEIVTNYNKAVEEYCEGRNCEGCMFSNAVGCNMFRPTQRQYNIVMNLAVDWSEVAVDTKILVRNNEDDERKRLKETKHRDISGVSDTNIYALYNMTFYPIEVLIERKLNTEKDYRKEREKLEFARDTIKSLTR